ncbi:sensor histidine kinase [Agathobaculum desmolans]|uniref:sensor histidine kinase n=1 Tax=Agathobaculum desmolans TaxID=39484 RepID=UPI00248F0D24|nr:HAMP domain-containing sensor histidine kinase [Agathobaculum desmolans]
MKKVVRSPILKGLAFALCLVCVAMAALTAGNTFGWFLDEANERGDQMYMLESRFENSWMLNQGFSTGVRFLDDALVGNYSEGELIRLMEDNFRGDYYAKLGDRVLKNADLTETEVRESAFYLLLKPGDWEGNITFYDDYLLSNWDANYEGYWGSEEMEAAAAARRAALQPGDCILLRMTDAQANELRAVWEEGRGRFNDALMRVIVLLLLVLAAFIYLLFVTGRRAEDEEVYMVLIDRMFAECNLALIAGTAVGTAAVIFVVLDEVFMRDGMALQAVLYPLTALLVCAFALVMELILSLTRNLKNHSFVQRSFILRAGKWCWKMAVHAAKWCWELLRKAGQGLGRARDAVASGLFRDYKVRNVALLLLGYTAVLAFCATMFGAMMDYGEGLFAFLLGVAWFIAAAGFVLKRVQGFDRIVEGLKRLRAGELTYKLTDMPVGVLASMAEDINSLGDGMQAALQNEIRAERMKSELITNVSHDLKTPLTSILNYSDLLCQEHLTPEEANDYAKIIHQKGMRLKNLTSDLFDISKVQSGAEQMICERLDACTLVRQALGEQDRAIEQGHLTLRVDIPEQELPIWADGRKMSRVMENLIGNCLKYAMQGTRVFVSVREREGGVEIELKNIANYAMDFDADTITERFTRGDAARSTEGSGLGLAIAKSYVTACGGTLSVDVDGDLFKVRIRFDRYV